MGDGCVADGWPEALLVDEAPLVRSQDAAVGIEQIDAHGHRDGLVVVRDLQAVLQRYDDAEYDRPLNASDLTVLKQSLATSGRRSRRPARFPTLPAGRPDRPWGRSGGHPYTLCRDGVFGR